MLKEGYNLEEGEEARQSAINKATRKYGYAKTVQKINALHIMNKNHPENRHKTQMDLDYLQMHREDLGAKT